MYYEMQKITPSIAAGWLKEKNNRNRSLAKHAVDCYAKDMVDGRWKNTHQNAIAFYENGELADGQHRLAAIVKSGVAIDFMVVRDLQEEDAYGIDAHRMRGTHDQIKIAGGNDWITKDAVAMARMMLASRKPSSQEIVEHCNTYRREFEFALEELNRNYFAAPVRVAVASAYPFESHSDLIRWCEVAKTGIGLDVRDRSAITFREKVFKNDRLSGGHGGAAREILCKLAMRSIYAYCRGESLTRLVEPKERIYEIAA